MDARKEKFVNRTTKALEGQRELLNAFDIALEVLKNFDGKVLNRRYEKAVLEKINRDIISTSLGNELTYPDRKTIGALTVEWRNYDPYIIDVKLPIAIGADWRVRYSETLTLAAEARGRRVKYIEELEEALEQYDNTYAEAMKLKAHIERFSHLNYNVRHFLKDERVFPTYLL